MAHLVPKRVGIGKYIAQRTCNDYARVRNSRIAEIEDPTNVNIQDHLHNMVDGHCSEKMISKAIMETIWEVIEKHWCPLRLLDQDLHGDRNSPDIYVKGAVSEKGRRVFNGVGIKFKGTVVCDYHRSLKTHDEQFKVLQETTSGKGNYIPTFKDSGTWMCIDAISKCPCHSANLFYNVSPGHLINHSCKKTNLKAVVYVMDG